MYKNESDIFEIDALIKFQILDTTAGPLSMELTKEQRSF